MKVCVESCLSSSCHPSSITHTKKDKRFAHNNIRAQAYTRNAKSHKNQAQIKHEATINQHKEVNQKQSSINMTKSEWVQCLNYLTVRSAVSFPSHTSIIPHRHPTSLAFTITSLLNATSHLPATPRTYHLLHTHPLSPLAVNILFCNVRRADKHNKVPETKNTEEGSARRNIARKHDADPHKWVPSCNMVLAWWWFLLDGFVDGVGFAWWILLMFWGAMILFIWSVDALIWCLESGSSSMQICLLEDLELSCLWRDFFMIRSLIVCWTGESTSPQPARKLGRVWFEWVESRSYTTQRDLGSF